MRIGFFTDTYFPQVSGVATSIKTLKEQLESQGHEVYIFTTTDPEAEDFEKDIVR
ncbi:MAG: glycosyltransferase family 4 protein, partial [Enterococcus viikkiensis]